MTQQTNTYLTFRALFIVFLVVLCLLGLSAIHEMNSSSVSMKDVTVSFSGAPVVSSVSVASGTDTYNPTLQTGEDYLFVIPVGTSYTVNYVANADLLSYQTQAGSKDFVTTNSGAEAKVVSISLKYTMQETLE